MQKKLSRLSCIPCPFEVHVEASLSPAYYHEAPLYHACHHQPAPLIMAHTNQGNTIITDPTWNFYVKITDIVEKCTRCPEPSHSQQVLWLGLCWMVESFDSGCCLFNWQYTNVLTQAGIGPRNADRRG